MYNITIEYGLNLIFMLISYNIINSKNINTMKTVFAWIALLSGLSYFFTVCNYVFNTLFVLTNPIVNLLLVICFVGVLVCFFYLIKRVVYGK